MQPILAKVAGVHPDPANHDYGGAFCSCGWGIESIRLDEIPEKCPDCGYLLPKTEGSE
jgi:hypothetical protein